MEFTIEQFKNDEVPKVERVEKIKEVSDKVIELQTDNTPRLSVNEQGDIGIIGDVSKLDFEKHTHVVKFLFPKQLVKDTIKNDDKTRFTEEGDTLVVERMYENRFLTPMQATPIENKLFKVIVPLVSIINDELMLVNDKHLIDKLVELSADKDMVLAMYSIVQEYLDIPEQEAAWMDYTSVVSNLVEIIQHNPNLSNTTLERAK